MITKNRPFQFWSFQKYICLTIFSAFLFASSISYSQTSKGKISGKVVNKDNEPLENVTVSLKGLAVKAPTSESGNFELSADAGNYELIISSVGYTRKTIKIRIEAGKDNRISTVVLSGSNDMDEVKIAGKTQVKVIKEQAFNVNIIDAKQLYNTSADLNQALNRTSGVRIREDGGVGSNFTFSLNGFSGKQVKFFLDGIPMDNFGSSLTLNNFPTNMAERWRSIKALFQSAWELMPWVAP